MITLKSDDQLNKLMNENQVVLLFSADWCPDCRVLDPVIPEIEQEFQDWEFVYVDRDQFIHRCAEYDVFGIPSFLAFQEGKEVGRFVSKKSKSREEIEEFMNKVNR